METRVVTANGLEVDDWFFLAGALYRIMHIDYSDNSGQVEIEFHVPLPDGRGMSPRHILKIDGLVPFQILNQ